jgi:hypothetical protein
MLHGSPTRKHLDKSIRIDCNGLWEKDSPGMTKLVSWLYPIQFGDGVQNRTFFPYPTMERQIGEIGGRDNQGIKTLSSLCFLPGLWFVPRRISPIIFISIEISCKSQDGEARDSGAQSHGPQLQDLESDCESLARLSPVCPWARVDLGRFESNIIPSAKPRGCKWWSPSWCFEKQRVLSRGWGIHME